MDDILVCSLASGSNGNAYYIEKQGFAILVDVGIGIRRLKNRAMTRMIDLSKVRAVFVSHEHSDHVYGLSSLVKQTGAVAFMTQGTRSGMRFKYLPSPESVCVIKADDEVTVGPFTVKSFAKPHDVVDPCSFTVTDGQVTVGVFTDIGHVTDKLRENLSECHMAFLESNYDDELLRTGPYPEELKERISDGMGHLSNVQACQLASQIDESSPLHTLFLSHLSGENNFPRVALSEFRNLKKRYKIEVMSREEASDVYRVTERETVLVPQKIVIPDRLDRLPLRY